jgi:hypothetical protein
MNVFRVGLHPDGLSGQTLNFREWAGYLLRQLHRLIAITGDPEVMSLADEVAGYPNVAGLLPDGKLITYLAAGHGPYASEHQKVNRDIFAFLADAKEPRPQR